MNLNQLISRRSRVSLFPIVVFIASVLLPDLARAVGTLIPAPNRVDMVYDGPRDILYITSGSTVLRYQLATDSFLAPFQLSGNLLGVDLSPDGNTLLVADSTATTNVWVHQIDLTTGQSTRVFFPGSFGESGTFAVAFGGDGAAVISSRFGGSGWVPLRRYDPVSGTFTTVAPSINQDSMVSTSGDGAIIVIAESNISSGPVDRYQVALRAITKSVGDNWFNYECGASRDGSVFAVPTYGGTFVYDGNLNVVTNIGVYAAGQPIGVGFHPSADAVFFPWEGTSYVQVYSTTTWQMLAQFDFQDTFNPPGNRAFGQGRTRLSRDGAIVFVTVTGGVRYLRHGLEIPQTYRLIVAGSPGPYGAPVPIGYGTNWLAQGTNETITVPALVETNGTRFQAAGWTGNGSVPASGSGTSVNFSLSANSVLTWDWVVTQYQLSVGITGNGMVSVTNGWYSVGTGVTLTATPGSNAFFVRWVGAVSPIDATNAVISLVMDQPHTLTALFAPIGASVSSLPGDWPTFGNGPAHTGYFPGGLGNATLTNRWSRMVANVGEPLQQVAVSAGRIFVTPLQYFATGYIASVYESSGQEAWVYQFPSSYSINPPSYDSGAVFVQRGDSGDTALWSFNATTGSTNWVSPHGAQWERYMAPTIADGHVWVDGGSYGGLYGFDEGSGAQLFFRGLDQYDGWDPSYYNGKLYTWIAGTFREHDPATGTVTWLTSLGWNWAGYTMDRTVAVAHGRAYFYGNPTPLFALDLASHQVVWQATNNFTGTPAVANGIIYANSGNNVLAFDTSGNQIGMYVADSPLLGQPIVTDDILLVASSTLTYVFDLYSHQLRQTLPVGGSLSLANGILYVATSAGVLYSFSSFVDLQFVISSAPQAYGAPSPFYGTNWFASTISVTNQVSTPVDTNMTRWVCTGWTGTGSVPANGSTNYVVVNLTKNSTLTWNWQLSQYQLIAYAAGQGRVDFPNGWFNPNSLATVTATPNPGYHFVQWSGDVPAALELTNPLTLTMDRPRSVRALFATDNQSPLTGDWPTFGAGPAHAGYFPGILGTNTFASRWIADVASGLNQPAIGNSRVFLTGAFFTTALHEYSGRILWYYGMPSAYSINPPTYDSGNVFVQRGNNGDTALWSFDAATGAMNWTAPHGAQWEHYMAPTVANGRVWVDGGTYGGMYGFDESTGGQLFFLNSLEQYDGWDPTYYNNKLYTWIAGTFREHDPETGSVLWSTNAGWAFGGYTMDRTVAAANGRAYFIGNPSPLCAVDLNTRQVAWQVTNTFSGTPAVANNLIYAISGTNVLSFDSVGNQLGVYAANSQLTGQPIVTDDVLIVGSSSSTYIFDLATFTLRQTIPVGGFVSLANRVLYIAASTGQVFAFSEGADARLQISSSAGLYGYPFPFIYGTNLVSAGASVSPSVTSPWPGNPGYQYVTTGWTGTGNAPPTGNSNSVTFVLTDDSTLAWNWKTQCFLTTVISNGTLNVPSGWFDLGTPVSITATPNLYFHFSHWGGDVSGTSTVATVSMNMPRSVLAYFEADVVSHNVPKWWLAQNGLPTTDAGALADTDGDGLANWQEYFAGTNPHDPGSTLSLAAVLSQPPASSLQLQWPSVAGKTYNIWRATDLSVGFTVLATNLPATAPLNVYPDSRSSEGSVFYRLEVISP